MKIMIAQFIIESNANIPYKSNLEDFNLLFGEDCIQEMKCKDVFIREGIEIIPSIYANANAGGVLEKPAFDYIERRILEDVKKHLHEIDGIFLHLHGASEVAELDGGSGDHHILKMIRQLVGPYLPIAVVCDPHGNLSKEYVESTTMIRSYRHSPHTDIQETIEFVCEMLVTFLRNRQNITPVYRKLPMILGGEQSVSADEPVKSINKYMDKLEEDPNILSCSWHVGYLRHDTDVAGCGIVVIPATGDDQEYANEVADKLAKYVWDKRYEFHYTGLTAQPEEAMKMAIEYEDKPVFITDSGDNVTSGSVGCNTFILRQVLELNHTKSKAKRFLFAGINDSKTLNELIKCEVGETLSISLGMNLDELSAKVDLDVIVSAKGYLAGYAYTSEGDFGNCITVTVKGKPIDIIVSGNNHPFVELHQFHAAGIDYKDYDIIIVKQGYIFPELKAAGKLNVMSLTGGATLQDTARLPFKRIMRPMFPIDNI
ncbi:MULTISPECIES: M81 family metallopeptidase [Niallia]|jgi:microcystin degradation protein MlrC|uniref:Microcystin degradation protein MlrC n=1 Tax=Niallia circulans TaxID=1397 RepID=A0A268F713_NIACI|nr:M81 family metallopeptidase [Niallia circulans]AYV68896.1 microcystin degradation protein MlrC [Niallia circulans]NRG25591.1 M81 family metallopeptidase [Niallia circulans]PAD81124.1 microcystin degradation protein MlrC [Niallia circulans]QJX60381.1 M81 family metallopeptidase [Niallia circulans]